MILLEFLLWTLMLYWIHRASHSISFVRKIHLCHHAYINKNVVSWHWNNLFLFNDNIPSTIDLWITEVIPTILFCMVTQAWWIFLFYYLWAALIQERIEHNSKVNVPILTSGKWHLLHHRLPCNYGLFLPLWDLVFNTYRKV